MDLGTEEVNATLGANWLESTISWRCRTISGPVPPPADTERPLITGEAFRRPPQRRSKSRARCDRAVRSEEIVKPHAISIRRRRSASEAPRRNAHILRSSPDRYCSETALSLPTRTSQTLRKHRFPHRSILSALDRPRGPQSDRCGHTDAMWEPERSSEQGASDGRPCRGPPTFATPRTLEGRGLKSLPPSNSDTRVVPQARWMFGLAEIHREHDVEAP